MKRGHTFGPLLGEYIKFRGAKQNEIGRECLLSYGQMSKIVNGRCNIFIDDAIAITEFLGVSIDFILNEEWKKHETRIGNTTGNSNQRHEVQVHSHEEQLRSVHR